jgi:outer membrane protein assembly factor BamE (lipoprotein component of BamABCDE complex)
MKTSLYAFLFLVFLCTACTPTHNIRGNFLQQKQIESVVVDEDSASDIIRKLGSPTAQSTFDNSIWYYIGQETEKSGLFDAAVIDEQIVIVTFDKESGTVNNVEIADAQSIDLPLEKSKTKTYGNEVTPVQQFLGNLGRFNVPQGQ